MGTMDAGGLEEYVELLDGGGHLCVCIGLSAIVAQGRLVGAKAHLFFQLLQV